jgi:hypothetical protein
MTTFLTLGAVTFANFEVPQKINFGGQQMLAVHKLIGGQREINAMGRDDDDITWAGLFGLDGTAVFRARFLDSMRIAGTPIPLTWDQFNYTVVIKEFKCNFERTYQIPYSITCTVVQDLNQPFPVLLPVGYNNAIANMINDANDLAVLILNAPVLAAIAAINQAVSLIPDLANASNAQIASVIAPIVSAQTTVSNVIASVAGATFL